MRRPDLPFRREVTTSFQFLVDRYHFNQPEYSEFLLPSVVYERQGLQIWIFLVADPHEGAGKRISVLVSLKDGNHSVKADLDYLVEAAVFAPRHHVAWKAHTAVAMRRTLDDNSTWIRRLMPILSAPAAADTIRGASEHPTDRAGNPKRRPRGIKWKYA